MYMPWFEFSRRTRTIEKSRKWHKKRIEASINFYFPINSFIFENVNFRGADCQKSAEIKPFEPDPVNTREGKSIIYIFFCHDPFLEESWFVFTFSLGNPLWFTAIKYQTNDNCKRKQYRPHFYFTIQSSGPVNAAQNF